MKVGYFEFYGPKEKHSSFVPKDETSSRGPTISDQSMVTDDGQGGSVSRGENVLLLRQAAALIPSR